MAKKILNRRKRRTIKRHKKPANYKGNALRATSMRSKQIIAPDTYYTRIVYTDVDTPQLQVGANSTGSFNSYNLNNLFDPSDSTNSHWAVGHKTMSNLYGRYHVYGAKVEFTAINNTDNTCLIMCKAQSGSHPTGFGDWAKIKQLQSNPDCWSKMLGPKSGNSGYTRYSKYFNVNALEGNHNYLVGAERFNTPCLADMNKEDEMKLYFFLLTPTSAPVTGQNDALSVVKDLKITYFVKYFERVDLYNTTFLTDEQESANNIEFPTQATPFLPVIGEETHSSI